MRRTRLYANQADKQRAYRQRVDLTADLEQLRGDLAQMARAGLRVEIDASAIDTTQSGREVLRQVVRQVRERSEAGR
jgi:hypothetical protein